MSHLRDSKVAGPVARTDNVLASRHEYPPSRCPPPFTLLNLPEQNHPKDQKDHRFYTKLLKTSREVFPASPWHESGTQRKLLRIIWFGFFSDFFWTPGPGRLFQDFLETFWLLAPRLHSLSQVHGTSTLGVERSARCFSDRRFLNLKRCFRGFPSQ